MATSFSPQTHQLVHQLWNQRYLKKMEDLLPIRLQPHYNEVDAGQLIPHSSCTCDTNPSSWHTSIFNFPRFRSFLKPFSIKKRQPMKESLVWKRRIIVDSLIVSSIFKFLILHVSHHILFLPLPLSLKESNKLKNENSSTSLPWAGEMEVMFHWGNFDH